MARHKKSKLRRCWGMKTQNNARCESVLIIQGKVMRVNLPFGMQSSDYPEPETGKQAEILIPRLRRQRLRAGRRRAHASNAARQRAYRDRKRLRRYEIAR